MRYQLFVLLFVICFCSCAKADDSLFLQSDDIKRVVFEASDNGYSIKSVQLKNKHTQVTFSDGSFYSFDSPILASIGLDGYWYVNGEKTDHVWTDSEDSIQNLLLGESDTSQAEGVVLSGLFEGIKTWSFYFEDNSVITLVKSFFSYDPDSILKGIAHRGFSSMAPENTLPAFRLARLNGFNYVETDIRFTSDGVPVLLHDQTIDRTSNGSGALTSFSLEDLLELDFGSWKHPAYSGTSIPTFVEFLDLCCKMDISPYLELKTGSKAQIGQLFDYIIEYGLINKTTILSFDLNLLRYAHEFSPAVRLGYLTSSLTETSIEQALSLSDDGNEVFISASNWPADMVELCKQSALPLEVWTVDDALSLLSLPEYVSGVTSNSLHAGIYLHEHNNR